MSESYSLISAREHFLSQPVVSSFTSYLAEYIAGRVFDPPYLTQTYRPKAQYCFTSLEDAWDQYIQEDSNRRFEQDLLEYESQLRETIQKRDDDAFIGLVQKIFAARPLVLRSNIEKIKVVKKISPKILITPAEFCQPIRPTIRFSVEFTDPRCLPFTPEFTPHSLRISSLTKAASAPRFAT